MFYFQNNFGSRNIFIILNLKIKKAAGQNFKLVNLKYKSIPNSQFLT